MSKTLCKHCRTFARHVIRGQEGFFCSTHCLQAFRMQRNPQALWEGIPGTCPKEQSIIDYEGTTDDLTLTDLD